MAAYKAPKGTKDVLPDQSYQWQFLEARIREIVKKYGFQEVRTPVFEHTELFLRGVGETTDIVQKEMYTFLDKGERSITLKPEGTAGVVRMFVENNLFGDTQPTKMFYLYSPTFRYERPQAGRLREHHQFGVEFFGASKPSADAECIAVATELLSSLGCGGLTVRLNSIGDPNCRPHYHEALKGYLHEHYDELCETCKLRLETNPLRVLDCKVESCQKIANGAPVISDYLCDDCRDHQNQLLKLLDGMAFATSSIRGSCADSIITPRPCLRSPRRASAPRARSAAADGTTVSWKRLAARTRPRLDSASAWSGCCSCWKTPALRLRNP